MRWNWTILRTIAYFIFICIYRGRVFGLNHVPRSGGVLVVSNHQSFLDPVLLAMPPHRESSFMARDTLFRNKYFSRFIRWLNAFPVRRDESDIGAIKESLRRLKSGFILVAFPEGTRTRDGDVGPMKPGIVLLARKARVPIQPAVVLGAFECLPRNRNTPRFHPLIVAYGRPLPVEQIAAMDDRACIDEIRRRIIEMKERFDRHELMNGRGRTNDQMPS
jgi:1-acyl-sn-glycerol-3-phosphate acyltransferase